MVDQAHMDDDDPEVRRVRLMANTTYPRRARRNPTPPTGWVLPTVISSVVAAVLIGAYCIYAIADTSHATAKTVQPVAVTTATPGPTVSESPAPTDMSLVERALQIKPLEDIEKGDRVIYQGSVCVWLTWNKSIATSTIECPGEGGETPPFQIQTGRLTPVELRGD